MAASKPSPQKEKHLKRIAYEIMKMREYVLKNQILYSEISDKCGITRPNISRFLMNKSPEPSIITFLLISEAIGYEMTIDKTNY